MPARGGDGGRSVRSDRRISSDKGYPYGRVHRWQRLQSDAVRKNGERLVVPEALKHYILNTRKRVDDLPQFIRDNHLKVQKMTLNFYPDENGVFKDRAEVKNYLESNPNVTSVCGGYNNLEFTRAGVNKGVALRALAEILSIDPTETMAIGDTENDLAIIKAAGIGVAMGNATPAVREQADYVTDDNESDGVATAMEHFIPAAIL